MARSLALAVGLLALAPALADVHDYDGDGLIDHVSIGDWDGNGRLEDADIMAGLLALEDDQATAELVAGVFELDPDNDGRGEQYGLVCDNAQPHVCIPRSGITLRGQGPGVTILRKGQQTPGAEYGNSQLIGLAVDGTTVFQSTHRISDVSVQDLSLETVGACDPVGTNAKGLRFMDCDRCSAMNVACKHLNQACVDFARCTFAESSFVTAEYVGNYDPDGAQPACTPGAAQPALYLYTSDGFITEHTGHRDANLVHVGGVGINLRSDGTVTRPEPWVDGDHSFGPSQRRIAQVLTTDVDYVARFTGIAVPLKRSGEAAGTISVEIRTAPGGVPGQVVPGYSTADFTTADAADLTDRYSLVLFSHRLTGGYPDRLTAGARYAIVVAFDGAVEQAGLVHVQGDRDGSSDAYAGGDAFAYDGSVWTARPAQDLSFSALNGFHRDVAVQRITVNDVVGPNDRYGSCLNIAKTERGSFSSIDCRNAGVVQFGNNGINIDAILLDFSITTTQLRSGGGWENGLLMSPFGGRQTASSGSVIGAPGTCVQVPAGARDQRLSGLVLNSCGVNGVDVGDGADVLLETLQIEYADGDGVALGAASAQVRNSLFVQNGGCAIRAGSLSASTLTAISNRMFGNGTDGTCVNGPVEADVVWDSPDAPYVLESDVVVAEGSTLRVDGATIIGGPGRSFIVSGNLAATDALFTSAEASPAPGDWCGIEFEPGSTGNLRNVDVRFAGGSCGLPGGGAAVHVAGASVRIEGDSRISESAGVGVRVTGAGGEVTISNSTIADNTASGVEVAGATAAIEDAQLIGNDIGAAWVDGGAGTVTRSAIVANRTAGVIADSSSRPVLGRSATPSLAERGLNNLLCNPFSVIKGGSEQLQARRNWWGDAPPPEDTLGPVNRGQYLLGEPYEVLRALELGIVDGTDVELCWEDAAPCRGYRVFRRGAGDPAFVAISGHLAGRCFTDAGAAVSPDALYYLVAVD